MARTSPSSTSTRTFPKPEAGGGGGGGGNPYRDWTTVDIHDSSLWQRQDGLGGGDGTLSSAGGVLTYNMTNDGINKQIGPGTNRGTFYILKTYLKPYEECGLAEPSGVSANEVYPEQFSIKVELLMDDTPITGPVGNESDNGYGQNGQVYVGFCHYASDQSGSPGLPHQTSGYVFARCFKNFNNDPTSTTNANLYKSGYLTVNAQSSSGGATWKCQFNPQRTVDHNCVIFQATFGATSRNSSDRCWISGGSYSTTNPRARFLGPTQGSNSGSAHQFTGANDRYVHIAIAFGAQNNSNGNIFSVRCKSLRYLIQPLSNREAFSPE